MNYHSRLLLDARRSLLILGTACLLIASPAWAQDKSAPQDEGYQVGEQTRPADNHPATNTSQTTTEPQRLARFDYISGNVTWRAKESDSWSKAKDNLPLSQGAQVWVTEGGRAEVRFDDGSLLRLGNGAVVTLQSVYSDSQGKFTQIKMLSGLITLRLRQENSIYQVNTPIVTVNAAGPARVRVGVEDTVEVGVRLGHVTIEGKQGKATLNSGDYVALHDADTPYHITNLPPADSWERWNDERDHLPNAAGYPVHRYYPPVFVPSTVFGLFLDFPIGHGYDHHWSHWDGRGAGRYRR